MAVYVSRLSSGYRVEIVKSTISSLPTDGRHLIANVLDSEGRILNHKDLSTKDKQEIFGIFLEYLSEEHPSGKWNIELNGPGMTIEPTFHIHGRLPSGNGQVLRCIFNPSNFADRLEQAENIDEVMKLL